jgi:DNA-binding MarR family transcriptional regulator
MPTSRVQEEPDSRGWTFLTNHAHALLCIAQDGDIRIQDIADLVGITLRAAQGIVGDLVDAGYVTRTRVGRRNRYEVHSELPFRHPLEREHQVEALLRALGAADGARPGRRSARTDHSPAARRDPLRPEAG